MTQVKGSAVVATLRFVRERFGEDGLRQLLAGLSEEDRARFQDGGLVSSWYPLASLLNLMRKAHELFGAQLPHIYREMGRASADYGLTTVYKIFFKVGSPHFIISKGSSVWRNYYDEGEMKATVSEKGHAVLELSGFDHGSPEYCERIGGWMQRTIELSGGKEFRMAHAVCRHTGGPVCRFEGWWS